MKITKQKQNGFIDIHLVLIAGAITAAVIFGGFRVYDSQKQDQANKQLKNSSASLTDSQKSLSAEEQKKLDEAQNKSASTESKPTTSTTSSGVKKPTTPPTPKTWNIVHPSASTCSKGEFTVYSSLSGGTPYYNYYNRAAIVQGTLPYKASKVVRCENTGFGPYNPASDGPTGEWLEFGAVGVDGGEKFINLNDVSISAPPN